MSAINNLSSQQFGHTSANSAQRDTNGQSDSSAGSGTTTMVTVKGSAPTISTRSG